MADALESHLLAQVDCQRIGFWHEIRGRAVLDQVPADRSVDVADIGAGAGLLGRMLRQSRPRATYRYFEPIVPVRSALAAAYGEARAMTSATDVGHCGVIVALDVIEHIEDDVGFLRSVLDQAAPGTTLVVTVPALPVLWSPWDERLGHQRRYTRSSLRRVLRTLPLDIHEVSYLFPEMVPAALGRRLLARGDAGGNEELPTLPRLADRALYGVGSLTYRCRRWMPVGTSLLGVGRRRAS